MSLLFFCLLGQQGYHQGSVFAQGHQRSQRPLFFIEVEKQRERRREKEAERKGDTDSTVLSNVKLLFLLVGTTRS